MARGAGTEAMRAGSCSTPSARPTSSSTPRLGASAWTPWTRTRRRWPAPPPVDGSYLATDGQLHACESARSALVPQIQAALFDAETGQRPVGFIEAVSLITRAELISDAHRLGSSATPPARTLCS
jgi:hypothetical protein